MEVTPISTQETYPLRLRVLRADTPTKEVEFPEDDWPGAFHLGVRNDVGELVATSSWVPRPCPLAAAANAVQLRGMATDASLQGSGVGGLLLQAGFARAIGLGYDLMWANARDTALGFYQRHSCAVLGDGFIDANTQLAHHVVVRYLTV